MFLVYSRYLECKARTESAISYELFKSLATLAYLILIGYVNLQRLVLIKQKRKETRGNTPFQEWLCRLRW